MMALRYTDRECSAKSVIARELGASVEALFGE